jgi:hypothetical protein
LQGDSETGAESGALSCDLPPDLARVVDAWAHLPESVKSRIMELVDSVSIPLPNS